MREFIARRIGTGIWNDALSSKFGEYLWGTLFVNSAQFGVGLVLFAIKQGIANIHE